MPTETAPLTTPVAATRWQAATGRGPRQVNADATAVHTDPDTGLTAFAVADGVGDSEPAAAAARLAADVAARAAGSLGPAEAIVLAQRELLASPVTGDSVLAVAVPDVGPNQGWCDVAWVGDCRVYHWNGRVLEQVTVDHTVAEFYLARHRPVTPRMRHLVTTSVRTVAPRQVGRSRTGLGGGRLLLCSDGVHRVLDVGRIRALLDSPAPAAEVAALLVSTAAALGGGDNATALVVDHADQRMAVAA